MPNTEVNNRLKLAISIARSAGAITRAYFRSTRSDVEIKADGTPVTRADRDCEEHLRSRIGEVFPEDGILGEEFPEKAGTSGYRWIVDPIDGTKSFVRRVPLYGTMVAVEREQTSILGVIVLPALEEYIYAARGSGAWHARGSDKPVRTKVSSVDSLDKALFCCGSVTAFAKEGRSKTYEALRSRCGLSRGWGDCYGYVLVATGRAELMVDPVVSLWDMAALPPILTEAGGTFTDWQGVAGAYGRDGLATNGKLFEQVLELTKGR